MNRIPSDQVRPRTIEGWWDGMVSGLADWAESPVWLQLNPQTERDTEREYLAYPLSDDEADAIWARHRRFEQLVGSHWCLRERCGTDFRDFSPSEEWMQFYEEYPPLDQPDYTDRDPAGAVRVAVRRNAAAGPSTTSSTP